MKSLFERARNYRHGVLETRLVARADDLNRPLTDGETYAGQRHPGAAL